jgi:hypothetical protein
MLFEEIVVFNENLIGRERTAVAIPVPGTRLMRAIPAFSRISLRRSLTLVTLLALTTTASATAIATTMTTTATPASTLSTATLLRISPRFVHDLSEINLF